jgi:predicted nucleic acid-binding protein
VKYLLDTCVLSEYVKKKPNDRVINWVDNQDELTLFVSILSIAELKKGIIRIKNSQPSRYKKLWNWFQKLEDILNTWAVICGQSEAEGKKLPIIDSLIAATAYEHDLIIVTRNITDFTFSSVRIFSPWD